MKNPMERSYRSKKREAHANRRAIKGLRDQSGSSSHLYHKGIFVAMHSSAPPPAEAYEEWLSRQLAGTRGRQCTLSGAQVRRAVIMRRGGSSYKEIGAAIGVSITTVKKRLDLLPEGLSA